MTEDETAGWHQRLNGHEFEQTLGDGEGQGSLVCCSPWGPKSWTRLSDGTELRVLPTFELESYRPLFLLHVSPSPFPSLICSGHRGGEGGSSDCVGI